VVECEFNPEANLVEFLFSPAEVSTAIEEKAQAIAIDIIEKLDMVGLLAVELFLTKEGELLVNEIAPRPHNSNLRPVACACRLAVEDSYVALGTPVKSRGVFVPVLEAPSA
jgi:5-(carboxyamino)imidazole ribonucleotide synthase